MNQMFYLFYSNNLSQIPFLITLLQHSFQPKHIYNLNRYSLVHQHLKYPLNYKGFPYHLRKVCMNHNQNILLVGIWD